MSVRYSLSFEQTSLDESLFYTNGVCDPLLAGRYLCEAVGNFTVSAVGYSLIYNTVNNPRRPSSGQSLVFSQDVAGIAVGVKYWRTKLAYDWYHALFGSGFVLNLGAEGGYVLPWGGQQVRLTDRFFLGQPQMRGFNIRGVGPRVLRQPLDSAGNVITDRQFAVDDALGGVAYYLGQVEVQIPLGASGEELGLRPSVFMDVGALWGTDAPQLLCQNGPAVTRPGCAPYNGSSNGFQEIYVGNSPSPRLAVGIGVSWNSPFGPFRFDLAKALLTQEGDDVQLFQFNVGTQF
jgi:outer membrane protein insertion porin family